MIKQEKLIAIIDKALDQHKGYQAIRDRYALNVYFTRYIETCHRMTDLDSGDKAKDVINRNYVRGCGIGGRWVGRAYVLHLVGYKDNRISKECFDEIVKKLAAEIEK